MRQSSFASRLVLALEARNMKAADLSKATKVSEGTISCYINGRYEAKHNRVNQFAKALKVNPAWLMGYDVPMDDEDEADPTIPPGFEPLPEMQLIPLVGEIACGMPITAEENLDGYVEAPKGRHIDFALTCKGESMIDAGISDGDVVFVRKQPTVENGQIAAVRVNGEATVKRVYINGNAMILQPANINFLPQTYAISELDDVAIEGLVVGWTHWV